MVWKTVWLPVLIFGNALKFIHEMTEGDWVGSET
jgi:hypothetical protein